MAQLYKIKFLSSWYQSLNCRSRFCKKLDPREEWGDIVGWIDDRAAYTSLTRKDVGKYEVVKEAILRQYTISKETHCRHFRNNHHRMKTPTRMVIEAEEALWNGRIQVKLL